LVVDTQETGKLVIKNGQLKRKVTVIPMNQIRANPISDNAIRAAQNLVGADKVFSALSLIEYDPVYRPVMEYVFGSRLICYSLTDAKTVAFNPQVLASTITLDGDNFDPEGILSGMYLISYLYLHLFCSKNIK
jgi:structural maintenance of chromosome 2